MKSIRKIITAMIAVMLSAGIFAQTHDHSQMVVTKTESIKVFGSCDMCKTRIEKAAKIQGVSKAEWSDDTKMLTLVYNPTVVTSDEVQKNIAAAGHDTGKYRADDKVYNSLPGCCHYERNK